MTIKNKTRKKGWTVAVAQCINSEDCPAKSKDKNGKPWCDEYEVKCSKKTCLDRM